MKTRLLLILFLLITSSCSHLFYQPDSILYTDKQKIQKYFKEIEIPGPEGKIIAWSFSNPDLKSDQKKPVHLVFFHGNAQNVSSHFYSLFWILERGYDFTIFDYPGYGGSEGESTRESTTKTGIEVIKWAQQSFPHKKIFVFGQSLGGNVAIYSASKILPDPQICGLGVDSSYLSYHTVARRILAGNWLTWLFQPIAYLFVSNSFSASEGIKNLNFTPILVMHGNKDFVVDIENGRDIFKAASQPKTFIEVEGGNHINAFNFEDRLKYQKLFLAFIDQYCATKR